MKQVLGIVVLSLLLTGCFGGGAAWDSPSKKINYTASDYSQKQNTYLFQTIRVLSAKPTPGLLTYDFNKGMFYGFGNTPFEAIQDAVGQCRDYIIDQNLSDDNLYCISTGLQKYHSHLGYSDIFFTKKGVRVQKQMNYQAELNKREQLRQKRLNAKKNRCVEMGFKEGTDSIAECILRLEEIEVAQKNNQLERQRRSQAALAAALSSTMSSIYKTNNTSVIKKSETSGGWNTGPSSSGMYKTCYYKSGLGTRTKTVFASAPCPMAY